ncbi:hypothetical protein [Alteribacter aurantiacus]|uniref:hypothetical protein n=1 Tax=Alteribacter aurantiacus TaxID=254410 RepID=UPI000478F0F2|nr:hypothetical protein [Alteribacter aurantiacus]
MTFKLPLESGIETQPIQNRGESYESDHPKNFAPFLIQLSHEIGVPLYRTVRQSNDGFGTTILKRTNKKEGPQAVVPFFFVIIGFNRCVASGV